LDFVGLYEKKPCDCSNPNFSKHVATSRDKHKIALHLKIHFFRVSANGRELRMTTYVRKLVIPIRAELELETKRVGAVTGHTPPIRCFAAAAAAQRQSKFSAVSVTPQTIWTVPIFCVPN
jgi:hypothetical protein